MPLLVFDRSLAKFNQITVREIPITEESLCISPRHLPLLSSQKPTDELRQTNKMSLRAGCLYSRH